MAEATDRVARLRLWLESGAAVPLGGWRRLLALPDELAVDTDGEGGIQKVFAESYPVPSKITSKQLHHL